MLCVTFVLLTLFSDVLCKTFKHRHRQQHDLDHNGIPDRCYVQNSVTSCMLGDGSWTALPVAAAYDAVSVVTVHVSPTPAAAFGSSWSIVPQQPSATQPSSALSSAVPSAGTSASGTLPEPSQFTLDKGSKWKIELKGNLEYDGPVANKGVVGDKARTGKIGDTIIWNFGDMMCENGLTVCGFGYGPAFYGTDDLMLVNTSTTKMMNNHNLVQPWIGDEEPQAPQSQWGMDTSNVVPLNDTHGIAYSWQIWRGDPTGSIVNRGNAVSLVTLDPEGPKAERVGPLLTGQGFVQLGLLASLRDGDYIYTYSIGGPSGIVIGRVAADDSVFDSTKYEFLVHQNETTWQAGVPLNDTTTIGAVTAQPSGQFGCGAYGSVFFNTYLQKYVMMCSIFMSIVNMYTADTPYGPWSAEYHITSTGTDGLMMGSYGAMAHPEYGAGQEFHFSIGPNSVFQMFSISFDY